LAGLQTRIEDTHVIAGGWISVRMKAVELVAALT